MYKRCVSEQSARRQQELENGLLQAMLTHPYEDISVSDLCDSLGIPRKSFYRYFSGKDGALRALVDHSLMDFSGELFSPDFEATVNTLERFFLFWKSKKPLLDALDRNGLSGTLIQRAYDRTMEEDLLAHQLVPFLTPLHREYAVRFLVFGLLSMVLQWHRDHYSTSCRDMASVAALLLSHPIIYPPAQKGGASPL